MAGFILYDIAFLVIFTLAIVLFLYVKRKNLKREGLLYLYRTRFGLKIINFTSKRFSHILKPMQYVIVACGYFLMGVMVWLLAKFSWIYLTSDIARSIKVPVVIPLIPYLPELFKLDFLPPFYFTYWIIIIAIIAIPHEFAHGIFARLNKIRVHSTGFGFLGPFLAAFVEPDEKETQKAPKISQLSILGAGTFANILVALLFFILMWGFFVAAFSPAGVNFNTYSTSIVNISDVDYVNQSQILMGDEFIEINAYNKSFYTSPTIIQQALETNASQIAAFDDSPAFNSKLSGAITEINGVKITNYDELKNAILINEPGDSATIKTISDGEVREYQIEFDNRNGEAFLGIGIIPYQRSGIMGKIYSIIASVKNPLIYYESSLGNLGIFIYDLLWWVVLVSISVALVNMLPLGIFDGGRFFLLTIWGITGSKKFGETAFKLSTWIILALIAMLMAKWVMVMFF